MKATFFLASHVAGSTMIGVSKSVTDARAHVIITSDRADRRVNPDLTDNFVN